MTTKSTSAEENDEYVTYGYVDPLEADRLFARLRREHVRFQFADISRPVLIRGGVRLARSNALELFVHRNDMEVANRIIQQSLPG